MLFLRPLLIALLLSTVAVADDDPDAALAAALTGDKPFLKGESKLVRTAVTKHFEAKYATEIKDGYGERADVVQAFLTANPDIAELLYTAIDPESDQIAKCLQVFAELVTKSAAKVKAYPQAAIAVAVTWDDDQAAYDYRGHQLRTRAVMPDGLDKVGPVANFDYLTAATDGPMKAAIQSLPWEMLVHVVNHRTPEDERVWAVKNYAKRRFGIGTCYKDIVYDDEMLRTEIAMGPGKGQCKLNNAPYTLESIKAKGGVCAMQADYAARVAKSLAVPAEYVRGEGNSGGLHAWVMWLEIKSATKDRVEFATVFEGRYLIDQYYVGTVHDPRTGKTITDRDLDRRLTGLGQSVSNYRHAELLMRAFPTVVAAKKLTAPQKSEYLRKVREVNPACEGAWLGLAAMCKDGTITDATKANALADQSLTVFARYPDFSWRIMEDLLSPLKDKSARMRIWNTIVGQYEKMIRPDLASEARLKLVEFQVEAKEHRRAAEGIAQTVRLFPAEGRFVPQLMDRLEGLGKEFKGGDDFVAKFYQEILPRVPRKRGAEPSQYCAKLYEKAVAYFKGINKPKEAAFYEQQLDQVKAGRG